jgi:hypothetical protein
MQQLLNLEKKVITFAAEVGLPTFFPKWGPSRYHKGEGKRHHDQPAFIRSEFPSVNTRLPSHLMESATVGARKTAL